MGLMPAGARNPFTKMDIQSVIGAMKATGSHDPDILHSQRNELLSPPKQLKLLGIICMLIGVFFYGHRRSCHRRRSRSDLWMVVLELRQKEHQGDRGRLCRICCVFWRLTLCARQATNCLLLEKSPAVRAGTPSSGTAWRHESEGVLMEHSTTREVDRMKQTRYCSLLSSGTFAIVLPAAFFPAMLVA